MAFETFLCSIPSFPASFHLFPTIPFFFFFSQSSLHSFTTLNQTYSHLFLLVFLGFLLFSASSLSAFEEKNKNIAPLLVIDLNVGGRETDMSLLASWPLHCTSG